MSRFTPILPTPKGATSAAWRVGEPSLKEAMDDPIVHLVMARDGLQPADVWSVVRAAQGALRNGVCAVRLAEAA